MKNPVIPLIGVSRQVLTGFAQIMLQPSALVGLVFLAGAFLNAPLLALFGLAGCITGVLTGLAGKFPTDELSNGLYGFNGGLVGLGIGYFYGISFPFLVLVLIGGAASSLLMYWMLRFEFRPLTFPFVLVTWIIMSVFSVMEWASFVVPAAPVSSSSNLLDGLLRGYGQVLFQENVITGAMFIVAITIRDWVQGIYATFGSIVGLVCGYLAGFPADAIGLGLFGYNGVLCGILFAGRTGKNFISALAAIILSVVFVRLAHLGNIPALTFPFVLASWIVLIGRAKLSKLD